MQETRVPSLGQEDPLEEEMATPSSILAWRIPWTEEPGGFMGSWGHKEWDTTEHAGTQKEFGWEGMRCYLHIKGRASVVWEPPVNMLSNLHFYYRVLLSFLKLSCQPEGVHEVGLFCVCVYVCVCVCNKVLLKHKRDRESFWHRHQKRAEKSAPLLVLSQGWTL